MTALFTELTTLGVLHRLDHMPNPSLKVTLTGFTVAVGGPTTNTAVMYTTLYVALRVISDPKDKAGAASGAPTDSGKALILLTILDEGPVSVFLVTDLAAVNMRVVDTTASASSPASREPAVSSIIEHPNGRMVTSTSARSNADAECVVTDPPGRVGAVLIDGHNLALMHTALALDIPEVDEENLLVPLEARPSRSHTLGSSSWKERLTSPPDFVDIAIVLEDFTPPPMTRPDGAQVAKSLWGFGATCTVRIRGDRAVQYWWDGTNSEIPVETAPDTSTLGAGDTFHRVFVWAIERGGSADPEHLIRFASSVAAVSMSSFGTRQ